jgi:uncharacterized protein (TIGR03083 family)
MGRDANDARLRTAIAAERAELAAILGALSPEQWDVPSLCAGWQVRDTVAHLTMPFRYSILQLLGELFRSRGQFDAMTDRCARRDGAILSSDRLAAAVGENVDHPWRPPGGGYLGALTHDVVHGFDVTVPLGIARRLPPDTLRLVLASLTAPRSLRFFGPDLGDRRLRALDVDWSLGSGTRELTGTAEALVLVLAGRRPLPAVTDGIQ